MKKIFTAFFLLLVLLLVIIRPLYERNQNPPNALRHYSPGYFVINLADQKTLTHTSLPLNVGDEYITAQNKIYRIVKITGNQAYVQELE